MHRAFTFVVGLGIGVASSTTLVAAQEVVENPTVTSDGEYVVATDDEGGDNDVEGGGTDIVVGDVSTGNSAGEVLGDPNAVYYPDLSAVPSVSGQPHTPTIVGLPIGSQVTNNLVPELDLVFTAEAAPAPDPATTGAGATTEPAPVPSGEPVDDQAGVPIDEPAG